MVVVHEVEKWHSCLSIQPFIIRMDQKSLKHLLEKRLSTPNQFNCLVKMMGISFQIQYTKGKDNAVANALSRASHGEIL